MSFGRSGVLLLLLVAPCTGILQGQVADEGSSIVLSGLVSGGIGSGAFAGNFNLPSVRNLPYSMVAKTTTMQTLADGTNITRETETRQMRDSDGRERTESGIVKDGQLEVLAVHVVDPVGRTIVMLFPKGKRARVRHLPEMTPQTLEQAAKAAQFRANAEASRKEHPSPSNTEDLPERTIAGVYAEGKRRTLTIPAGKMGNDKEIKIVTETWTSPDLKLVLESVTDDPRRGKTTRIVSELNRAEPSAALFQVPADYKVEEQK